MKHLLTLAAMAALLLAGACSGKYEEWYEPQGGGGDKPTPVNVFFTADSVPPIDLRGATADSVRIFAPTIVCDAPYTVSYTVAVFNAERTDSVLVGAAGAGRALRKAVQQALMTLFGPNELQREAPMDITARILVDGAVYVGHADSIPLVIIPKGETPADVWYVMGSHIGDGQWRNTADGLYTSLIPMYANPENYAELVYAAYLPAGSELRVLPTPGDDEHYIGGGDETGGQTYQSPDLEGDPLDNIIIGRAGYYRLTVNPSRPDDPTITIDRLDAPGVTFTGVELNPTGMAMTAVTTVAAGRNHDWLLSSLALTADERLMLSAAGTQATDTTSVAVTRTYGGAVFPAGRALERSGGIPAPPGDYVVLFNDLLRLYRFVTPR